MKIIVLAAGKGERLLPITANTPKPLIDMGNGKTLFEEQLERIQNSGVIDEIILVIGYLAEQVESKIETLPNKRIGIKTIYNPFYDVSNNLVSLWFAIHEMDSDFMITNGDNIFSTDVFTNLVKNNSNGIFLSISRNEECDDDDMKVTIENDLVIRVSKHIEADKVSAESPGLALIHGPEAISAVRGTLEGLVRIPENRNGFWLEIFNELTKKGVPVKPWEFDGKNKWQEIDFHMDIGRVQEFLRIKI